MVIESFIRENIQTFKESGILREITAFLVFTTKMLTQSPTCHNDT